MTVAKPNVKIYGSSYGKYGGNSLASYTPPEPNTPGLNDADMKDVGEWKPFEKSVKDFILGRLGAPVIDVELTPFQLESSIEEAITTLEYHAPNMMTQYAVFETSAGINLYELPAEIMNGLNDVWNSRNFFDLGASPGSLEYDFAIMFFTNTGLFNNYNVSEYLLMQQYLKQISKVLGQGFNWQVVNGRFLQIWPTPSDNEGVILEFRALDAATLHPAYKNWVQRFALGIAKGILGRTRSKYAVLPGPSGGSKLDGEILLGESKEEREKLMTELTEAIEGPSLFITG